MKDGFDSRRDRQNFAFPKAYRYQTWKNRPLNCKGIFREFPNLIVFAASLVGLRRGPRERRPGERKPPWSLARDGHFVPDPDISMRSGAADIR